MQNTPNLTAAAAIARVLDEAAGDALSTAEIARRALAAGWATSGATPERTIAARLAAAANDDISTITRCGLGEYLDASYLDDEQRAWLEAEEDARLLEAGARADERRANYGLTGTRNCGSCGRLKTRPADRCDHCGDDPVSHNGDPHEYNRAYGWAA